ncbi:MAG: BON domain-containing protein [Candidatus Promineifilaceae bacterium]|nr:BON domain-containing protein [Candidatus Promineifilaceae bacterium]
MELKLHANLRSARPDSRNAARRLHLPGLEAILLSDAHLRAAVLGALLADARTALSVIEVTVEGRIASLSGTVRSRQIRRAAEEIARHQLGIAAVRNAIEVQRQT